MIVSVTGHRPDKLGGYNNVEAKIKLVCLATDYFQENRDITMVLTGMALGWDQYVALACIRLRLPFTACIPFKDQESLWNSYAQTNYRYLMSKASKIVIVSPGGFTAKKMQVRNEYMVDNSAKVIAMHDGTRGGTFNCVQYAVNKQKPVINLYDKWNKLH